MEKLNITRREIAYWRVFRLMFVVFHFYLVGDILYRWDGFRYYSKFSEFIPSIALIGVIWSLIAAILSLLIWTFLNVLEWIFARMKWKSIVEQILVMISAVLFSGLTAWIIKKIIWQNMSLTYQVKLAVYIILILTIIILTLIFRNKLSLIQERITPLVWLFGILVILSIPYVIYHTWIKEVDSPVPKREASADSATEKNDRNIIVVIFDALSAENMSLYGYNRPTTPFISDWSKGAYVFSKHQASSTYTAPTIASMITGKRVWTHQLYHPHGPLHLSNKTETVPRLLKDHDYYNMAFIANSIGSVEAMSVADSFDIAPKSMMFFSEPKTIMKKINRTMVQLFSGKILLYDWLFKGDFVFRLVTKRLGADLSVTQVPPELAFKNFFKVIDETRPKKYFAWIHVLPPHYPYLPPDPYMGMFDFSQELRSSESQEEDTALVEKYTSKYAPVYHQYPAPIENIVETLEARYDEFVRYCDSQFRNFILELEKRNMMDNTIIILTADHGESFDHNYLLHGGYHLYQEIVNIPLIIMLPENKGGRVINDVTEQIDISATIADLADIQVPSWMEGKSLVPLMNGEISTLGPAFSMSFERNPGRGNKIEKGAIAVTEEQYKLIHYLELDETLLFNLDKDPDERYNLIDKKREIGNHLLKLIKDSLKKANERIINQW